MPIIYSLIASVVVALCALLPVGERTLGRIALAGSTIVMVLLLSVGWPAIFSQVPPAVAGTWFIDSFTGLLLVVIGFIQWTAIMVSVPYLHSEFHEKDVTLRQVRLYFFLAQLFVFSMVLTVISNNIGIMWVALEGTTLATTMLVAFYTKEGALEAAWKYILLCSVGISLGLLGIMIFYYAAISSGAISTLDAMTWTSLRATAHSLNPHIVRWAFVFVFLGYGAKVGLVPMHTWLPDAHGRTPSPMSGMLSGVLLNVALFAILRFRSVTNLALGGADWSNHLFLVFGAISFIVPAAFIMGQVNYKRILAYSSIEHMGLIVFAVGLGLPGMIAALVHLIGHAIIKSMLFFGTGNVLLKWKSTKFDRVGPVMPSLPFTGVLFLLGILGLLAVPPSPIFMAEYLTFSAAIVQVPRTTILLLAAGCIIFAGMMMRMMPFLFAKKTTTPPHDSKPERWNLSHTAMTIHLVGAVVLGVLFLMPQTIGVLEHMAIALN